MSAPSVIKSKLARGEVVICAKASYHDPDIIELMGTFGFDGIWICLEHKRLDPSVVHSLIRACRLGKMDPIIRIKPASYADLLWLLEAGVPGLMLPRVGSVGEVEEIVRWMKFPPAGERGFDGVQAEAGFGRIPPDQYLATANDGNFLVVQIENPAALPHLDAIAAQPGADILFVGPGDLTLAMGKPGKMDDPDVVRILEQVPEVCRRHGKAAGIPCSVQQVPKYVQMGYRFFNVISDYRCVFNGLAKIDAELRQLGFALAPR